MRVITRVVDYGGLFWGDLPGDGRFAPGDHRAFRPDGWVAQGLANLNRLGPIAERLGLTPLQLACAWNLAHPVVECVVPTLIQEAGGAARPIEDKRAELAALPAEAELAEADVAEIREIGDNAGCMRLKGASPDHDGPEAPDRWVLSEDLVSAGRRYGVDPQRDLQQTALS